MYLNIPNVVIRAHLPSLISLVTHEISVTFDVKGEATEASNSDKEIPTDALLSAAQSFAPSPQKQQTKSRFSYCSTRIALQSGDMRANIVPLYGLTYIIL